MRLFKELTTVLMSEAPRSHVSSFPMAADFNPSSNAHEAFRMPIGLPASRMTTALSLRGQRHNRDFGTLPNHFLDEFTSLIRFLDCAGNVICAVMDPAVTV